VAKLGPLWWQTNRRDGVKYCFLGGTKTTTKSAIKKQHYDKDKEIRCHQPSSPAAASHCPVTHSLPLTFVAVGVVMAVAVAVVVVVVVLVAFSLARARAVAVALALALARAVAVARVVVVEMAVAMLWRWRGWW
jgi:hypothetical protein